MIYCIWYPTGGYGTYLSTMIDRFGKDFVRPQSQSVEFSSEGNSHNMLRTVPKYCGNSFIGFDFDNNFNYSVLIDNGINCEDKKFLQTFPNCKVLKICYDLKSWPIIAHTLIVKALDRDLQTELVVDQNLWPVDDDWAVREKYFLFLSQHDLRNCWTRDQLCSNLNVADIWDYTKLVDFFSLAGIDINDFEKHHSDWKVLNNKYFKPIHQAKEIIDSIQQKNHCAINHITDLWDQAVVNYYIWLEYGIEVPANTYSNWFSNTKQIEDLINEL